jgi:hypothetical protein
MIPNVSLQDVTEMTSSVIIPAGRLAL